jgi:arginase
MTGKLGSPERLVLANNFGVAAVRKVAYDQQMTPIIYAGLAADRNDRAMSGSVALGNAISQTYGWTPAVVCKNQHLLAGGWRQQLEYARPSLEQLAEKLGHTLDGNKPTLLIAGRCAASVATLPQVASRHPHAALVWFDAHGDCNVPALDESEEGAYLGGMVISAAAGAWDSGLGSGLRWENVILVGSRDLDPPEQERISTGQLTLVAAGPDIGRRLTDAIGDRSVYIHLDCDVLDAGLFATEYQVKGGLTWQDLREAFYALSTHKIVGLEIAECEVTWPDGSPNDTGPLLNAIEPLLAAMATV